MSLSLEHGILAVACLFFLFCIVYAARGGNPRKLVANLAAPLKPLRHPIVSALEQLEAEGKEAAAREVADLIKARYAAEHRDKLSAAIAPKSEGGSTPPVASQ